MTIISERRREKVWRILWQYGERKISIAQAKAQFRDLGCEEWEIDLYIDGTLPEFD